MHFKSSVKRFSFIGWQVSIATRHSWVFYIQPVNQLTVGGLWRNRWYNRCLLTIKVRMFLSDVTLIEICWLIANLIFFIVKYLVYLCISEYFKHYWWNGASRISGCAVSGGCRKRWNWSGARSGKSRSGNGAGQGVGLQVTTLLLIIIRTAEAFLASFLLFKTVVVLQTMMTTVFVCFRPSSCFRFQSSTKAKKHYSHNPIHDYRIYILCAKINTICKSLFAHI